MSAKIDHAIISFMKPRKRCRMHPDADLHLVQNGIDAYSKFFGRWCCTVCDKFVAQAKNPATAEVMLQRQHFIRKLLRAQIPIPEKELHCLCLIYNEGTLDATAQYAYRRIFETYADAIGFNNDDLEKMIPS